MSEQTQTLIGGKTVSEKYTIKERSKNGQHGRTQLFEGSKQKFIGSFEEYDKAKEIMDILNEDEKRKSFPRIDKNVKEGIINRLEELRCEVHSVEMKEGFSEERICSTEFANAIKIIKDLIEV